MANEKASFRNENMVVLERSTNKAALSLILDLLALHHACRSATKANVVSDCEQTLVAELKNLLSS